MLPARPLDRYKEPFVCGDEDRGSAAVLFDEKPTDMLPVLFNSAALAHSSEALTPLTRRAD